MHIKVLQSTTVRDFEDHHRRDIFKAGIEYDVETSLGALFVREGWAELVGCQEAGAAGEAAGPPQLTTGMRP